MILNKDQVNQIISILKTENKVKNQQVLEEMTDHMCCLIEKKMVLGQSFEEAFADVEEQFDLEETQKIEKSVQRINTHIRLKRKIKSISAVAATFILLLVAVANAQNKPEGPPIKGDAEITSRFGKKRNVPGDGLKYHRGVDYKVKSGTP
ncbi:MAG: hypothetical protein WBA74_06600, partial [Cyclobacteriaceae bacterium]